MKKPCYLLTVLLLLLFSCSDTSSTENTSKEAPLDAEKEETAPVIYTAHAALDGPDNELFIFVPGAWDGEEEEVPEFTELHVIPYVTAKNGIFRDMTQLYQNDFRLYNPFDTYSGTVKCYYDKEKHHLAAEYQVIDGKADGVVKIITPKGRTYMEREYANGKWIKSTVAPACSDWRFTPSSSNITINDLSNGQKTEDGQNVVELMPSLHSADANYTELLDKSTYVRPLKINNKTFTGQLKGYFGTPENSDNLHFSLDFVEGVLDGDVKIYDDWGNLTLHEIFVKGALEETVYVINWEEMDGMAKPIIYLYPEEIMDVRVELHLQGTLTHSYPKYENGWTVAAHPDGTLFDAEGKEYYALYWEGENAVPFTLNEGTVVAGENTVAFLESALETLGLNRREANEFIMYWLPRMENNAYNLIHFSTDEYAKIAELTITPTPETMIRVMMVFQPLKSEITVPHQDLELLRNERKGFTVVEWGGKEMSTKEIW